MVPFGATVSQADDIKHTFLGKFLAAVTVFVDVAGNPEIDIWIRPTLNWPIQRKLVIQKLAEFRNAIICIKGIGHRPKFRFQLGHVFRDWLD